MSMHIETFRDPSHEGKKKKKKKTEGGGGGGMIEVIILSYDNTKYNWPHTDSRHLSIKLLFTH